MTGEMRAEDEWECECECGCCVWTWAVGIWGADAGVEGWKEDVVGGRG